MARTAKYDIYAAHAADYVTPKEPVVLTLKPAQYLSITGHGEPGGKVFESRLGALYNVAFTVKMARKFAGRDYAVSKLEGLWWGDSGNPDFFGEPRNTWNWKLLIRTPDFITEKEVREAIAKLRAKGKPEDVSDVKLESFDEGKCVQMLHLGPYEKEAATIAQIKAFAEKEGLRMNGLHHEIYLSDPRRVAPAKLRTILRYPVR